MSIAVGVGPMGNSADLRSFFELSVDIIYEANARGLFTFVNPAATRVLGYEETELIGLHYTALIRPDYREKVRDHYTGQVASGIASTYFEFPCVTKDGREVWIGQHVHTIMRDGKPCGFQAVARDISDRMALEDALAEARDEALASARLKAEFLANMSHELRTPMNGVLGMLGVLLDTKLDDEQRDIAQTAKLSAESLLTLLNDILDFSKIESRKLTFEKVEFDLRETLEGSIELLAGAARKKGIELGCSIDGDVPRRVQGDAGRLRQILLNLIGNAIKFTESGGVVVRVGLASRSNGLAQLLFTVTDTGIGISAEGRARLFQPFVQADTSTTRRFGGTGLGLAISKQLVTMMNGEIDVESEPGHGSTFWFTAEFEASVEAPVAAALKPRVLIVDDSATARDLMSLQLSAWEVPNDAVESPVAAIRMLREAVAKGTPYGVVISDVQMPEMDGLTLARLIQAQFAKTRVIIASSTAPPCPKASLPDKGVAVWLGKPIKSRQLEAAVFGQSVPEYDQERPHVVATQRSARILVVEDNAVNQKVAVRQLQKLGYSADVAANGLEALHALNRIEYAAVLMDCHMPEMDGYEATAAIRRSGNDIPIIALTASVQSEDRERCIAAGMNDFISKPTREADLARVLAKWIGEEDAVSSSLDPESITALRELGGDDESFLKDLFSMYVDQADQILASLDRVDEKEFIRAVHALGGSSRNIGALTVGELCRAAEIDSGRRRNEYTTAIAGAYARVRNEVMRSVAT